MLCLAAVAALVFVLLLPTILSQGILSAVLRGQMGGQVGASEVSWTGGVSIRALDLEQIPETGKAELGYAFWCREVSLETSLLSAALAGASGGQVEGRIVLRGGGVRVELPAKGDSEPAPEEQTPEEEAGTSSEARSYGMEFSLVLEDFDVHVRRAGGPLLILEGLEGEGRVSVSRDGSMKLTSPLELRLKSLKQPLGPSENPWDGLLEFRGATLRFETLVIPASGDPEIVARLSSPSIHVAGLEFREVVLTAKSEGSQLALDLRGAHPGAEGTLHFQSRIDRSNATRWPVSLDLDLRELPIRGVAGDFLPCLIPLAHSVNNRAGRFPPVSIRSRGDFKLVFNEDGLDGQATLDSLQAKGEVGLGAGQFEASLLIRGYASALTQLEVGSVLAEFLPRGWAFEGGTSPFNVSGDRLRLHSFPLRAKFLDLSFSAEVGVVSGDYTVKLRGGGRGALPKAALAVLKTLDRAGGVKFTGNVWDPKIPDVGLPARNVLLEAIKAEGAGAVWLERGGPLLEGAKGVLGLPR
ncbi:MAG: hypothetical protein JKY65_21650 [Planctomycetes bacterium]|nr:hypothetical protein [Planctomycetota bacterium]